MDSFTDLNLDHSNMVELIMDIENYCHNDLDPLSTPIQDLEYFGTGFVRSYKKVNVKRIVNYVIGERERKNRHQRWSEQAPSWESLGKRHDSIA